MSGRFIPSVPGRAADWTPALDAAALEWWQAADIVLNATVSEAVVAIDGDYAWLKGPGGFYSTEPLADLTRIDDGAQQ